MYGKAKPYSTIKRVAWRNEDTQVRRTTQNEIEIEMEIEMENAMNKNERLVGTNCNLKTLS